MIDFNALVDATNRRAALDRLATYFVGEISDEEAERFCKTLWILGQSRQGIVRPEEKALTIFVNSAGGSVPAGFAMMEFIYRVRRDFEMPVYMCVTGIAYSMAAVVLQAASHRVMGELSTLMLHSPSWVLAGKDSQIFQDYEHLAEGYRRIIGKIFETRTGYKTADWWIRLIYSERDRFLTAQECLKLGLVDEITPIASPLPPLPLTAGGDQPAS